MFQACIYKGYNGYICIGIKAISLGSVTYNICNMGTHKFALSVFRNTFQANYLCPCCNYKINMHYLTRYTVCTGTSAYILLAFLNQCYMLYMHWLSFDLRCESDTCTIKSSTFEYYKYRTKNQVGFQESIEKNNES